MSFAEAFLTDPFRFPARPEGDHWGNEVLTLRLPGGVYGIGGLSPAQSGALSARFGEYCEPADGEPRAAEVTIFRATDESFRRFDLRGWEMHLDFDYAPDRIRVAGLRVIAWMSLGPVIQCAIWTPDEADFISEGGLENILRIVVAHRLLDLGGLMLHSAALADDSSAWLFVGYSGAGKSTLSQMALERGYRVLSDDMNAVVPTAGGFVAERVPFAGTLGSVPGAPRNMALEAIHHIRQGARNQLHPMASHERLTALLACASFVNQNPCTYARLIEVVADLCREVPGSRLEFNLDGGFVHLLQPMES